MPRSPNCRVGFEAVLVTVMLPLVHPVLVGAKVAVIVAVWPAARTVGRLNPETVNPLPFAVMAEIVTLVCPLLVKTADWLCDCAMATEPNLILAGLLCSCWLDRACSGRRPTITRKTVTIEARTEKGVPLDWGSLIRSVCRVAKKPQRYR